MNEPFRLLMISAMYENGGNTTQRLLDGHPELVSYPFESQLGTRLVQDHLSSLYPAKYRWPVFALEGTPEEDYEAIIDEECKVRIKTPPSSKFREATIALDDRERKASFVALLQGRPRSRATLTEAFFRASAEAWRIAPAPAASGSTSATARSSASTPTRSWPILRGARAQRGPQPVVRLRGHQEARGAALARPLRPRLDRAPPARPRLRGPVPWTRAHPALRGPRGRPAGRPPGRARAHGDRRFAHALLALLERQPLREVYPWGTIRTPTPEANQKTAAELSPEEHEEVRRRAQPLLGAVGYA